MHGTHLGYRASPLAASSALDAPRRVRLRPVSLRATRTAADSRTGITRQTPGVRRAMHGTHLGYRASPSTQIDPTVSPDWAGSV